MLKLSKDTQLTHREIAKKLGVERSYVTHVINGRYKVNDSLTGE